MKYTIKPSEKIFKLTTIDKKALTLLSTKSINHHIKLLRKYLELQAQKCRVYASIIEQFDKEILDLEKKETDYAKEKWLSIVKIHRNIYDVIGYLLLLQMDAVSVCISLFQAETDTEILMLCKHAYTIIHEAQENILFKKVSLDMQKYPTELIKQDDLKMLWKNVKQKLKELSTTSEAKRIRNSIDAHKSPSFIEQINTYEKCQFAQSIINLYTLIEVIDMIQEAMSSIHTNIPCLLDSFRKEMQIRMKKAEEILEFLSNESPKQLTNECADF